MLLALTGDTHCGVRNSSEVIQNYQNRFYSDIFFPYLQKHGIKNIIHLGDFFDNRKFLSIKSLHSNRKAFLEPLRDLGIHMDIILGNHDVHYRSTNEVNSLKEVFGFFINSIDIIHSPRVLKYGSLKIGALPWIAPDNEAESLKFIQNADADILVSHLELSGFEMMKGMPVASHGMDKDLFSRFSAVYSGHYHTRSSQGNIHYLGTPFELTWADCHDPKYFYILDTETREITEVRNPYTIHRKIYYTDAESPPNIADLENMNLRDCFVKLYCVSKKDFYHYDSYVKKLQEQSPYELKIIESLEKDDSDISEETSLEVDDTQEVLRKYVESYQTDLSKDRIYSILSSLLLEAQTKEDL